MKEAQIKKIKRKKALCCSNNKENVAVHEFFIYG